MRFYRHASSVVADPRVRRFFSSLAEEKHEHLQILEEEMGSRSERPRKRGVISGREEPSPLYPFEAFQDLACFVCGYTLKGDEFPDSCPECGAARYTFQKDIGLRRAQETALNSDRRLLEHLKILEEHEKVSASKRVLKKLVRLEESTLKRLEKESLRTGEIRR